MIEKLKYFIFVSVGSLDCYDVIFYVFGFFDSIVVGFCFEDGFVVVNIY